LLFFIVNAADRMATTQAISPSRRSKQSEQTKTCFSTRLISSSDISRIAHRSSSSTERCFTSFTITDFWRQASTSSGCPASAPRQLVVPSVASGRDSILPHERWLARLRRHTRRRGERYYRKVQTARRRLSVGIRRQVSEDATSPHSAGSLPAATFRPTAHFRRRLLDVVDVSKA
jgi:hypothetical protein